MAGALIAWLDRDVQLVDDRLRRVPAGAKIRYQVTTSERETGLSLTVGTSGNAAMRSSGADRQDAQSPAIDEALAGPSVSIWKAWRPASVSCMAGAEPR